MTKKPKIPQKDAVKKLRELYYDRLEKAQENLNASIEEVIKRHREVDRIKAEIERPVCSKYDE